MDKKYVVSFINKINGHQYDCVVKPTTANPTERYLVFGALLKMNANGLDTDNYIHIKPHKILIL